MLFKGSISWCIITRSSEDEGSNDVKGTLKVFATRHLSADTLLPLSRYPAADNLLSAGPFLHQLALHVVTSLYKAKIKPRAADGLKVGEDLCVIWNGSTFQLFQINGLILSVQHWSSLCPDQKWSDQIKEGSGSWEMASKTYIYRDLVTGCEMFNVAHPHVSTIIPLSSPCKHYRSWWYIIPISSPCKHYHPTIIPM